MTKSKILFYLSLCFILGIFLNSIIVISQLLIFGFLVFGLVIILSLKKELIVLGFCLSSLVLGIYLHQRAEFRINNNQLLEYNDQEVVLVGRIIKEPDIRESNQRLLIKPKLICLNELECVDIKEGRVLVSVKKYPNYYYNDQLEITGELKTPVIFEDFDYRYYLARQGIYSVSYYSTIELVDRRKSIYGGLLNFKEKLRQVIYNNLSFSKATILSSIILGDKNRIGDDLKERLNTAGVRHITAVSGMHVVILSSFITSLLLFFGFWRKHAFYISIIIVLLFVILTGFQTSAIRAGIMGSIFLLGHGFHRKSISSRNIVFAGAVMLAINPLLLLGDVGFQLSFLAAIGIISFGNILKNKLKNIFKKEIYIPAIEIISMTLAAQIFTLPILIYNFERISLIALITNFLIIPVIPFIMIFGFIFVLSGVVSSFLGLIFSFPIWFLLSYLLRIVDIFSNPIFSKNIRNVHWSLVVIFYSFLFLFVWYLKKKQRLKFLG
tara:strand:+ start:2024 stop:3508 length:1485 start_codon:yes stop_codon:yes gene_type:complete